MSHFDHDAFCVQVANMRHAQKEYFRTKSPTALESAKRLEKAVDSALREYADQPKLF